MIFLTSVVTLDEAVNNRERFRLLEEAILSRPYDIDIATFPAGFLQCYDFHEVKEYANKIKELSDRHKTHIALGIDYQDSDKTSTGFELPYLGLLTSPDKNPRLWKQHSFKSTSTGKIQLSSIVESRTIQIRGLDVEILACGDLFNPAVLDDVIHRKVDVAIALVHSGAGTRIQTALKTLANNGVHGFSSIHAKGKNAIKHGYLSSSKGKSRKISTNTTDYVVESFNRIEAKIWEL